MIHAIHLVSAANPQGSVPRLGQTADILMSANSNTQGEASSA